jgi:hypothetical protein
MITKIEWKDFEKEKPDLNTKGILHYWIEATQTFGFVKLPTNDEYIKRLVTSFDTSMIRYWAFDDHITNYENEEEYLNEARFVINLIQRAEWDNEDDN